VLSRPPGSCPAAGSWRTVYWLARDTPPAERMSRLSAWFAAHLDDRVIDESPQQRDD
jgi:hypothetical protein